MRIVQISDLHFTRLEWSPSHICSKRSVGQLNWLFFRRQAVQPEVLEHLPLLFQELGVECILAGGDMTSTSLPSEYSLAKKFFDKISCRKLFIPGNHDHYTKESYREKRFYKTFKNHRKEITHPAEFFTLENHGVEAHRLMPGWWCVTLDTAPATSFSSSNGIFFPEVEQHLEEVLKLLGESEKIVVLNHFPFFQNDNPLHRLIRGEALQALIEKWPNIRLYLHGHTHRYTVADLQVNNLPVILDAGCPVQKEPMSSWNLLDLSDEGCKMQSYRWEGSKWAVFKERSFSWTR